MTVCGETGILCWDSWRLSFEDGWGLLTCDFHFLCCSLNMKPFGVKVACIEPGFFKTNVTDSAAMRNNLWKIWDRVPQQVKDDYGHNFLDWSKFPE